MDIEAYEFLDGSGLIVEVGNGIYQAQAQLATFQSQSLSYEDQGLNADGMRVIEVYVHGDEMPPIQYNEVCSTPYALQVEEKGVELIARTEGGRKGSITTDLPT